VIRRNPENEIAGFRCPKHQNPAIQKQSTTTNAILAQSLSRSSRTTKIVKREKGIWQRRYWEHAIRDDADLERHADYVHFNPVKHGYVKCVADWPHSSFRRYVDRGLLDPDWGGDMGDIQGAFGE
jgi:hypothetical protein